MLYIESGVEMIVSSFLCLSRAFNRSNDIGSTLFVLLNPKLTSSRKEPACKTKSMEQLVLYSPPDCWKTIIQQGELLCASDIVSDQIDNIDFVDWN
ncbi:MAG: hypothetical protein J5871_03445 [Bacteroidales bacterium]|nr:hypothetical protein [Bacteroidales bacterium]